MVGASFSTRKQDANIGRERDQQGVAYLKLALVEVYGEGRSAMPERSPCEMVKHLMEQRGLRQVDLVPVRSRAQVKALAGYFGVSVELFL